MEELLSFVPIEEYKESLAADEVEACFMPLATESKDNCISMPSFLDFVIIVNTQNFDQEMIISRRSTYQRILALEKEGTQVVERDLSLPVDVIVSAAVCLAWYDCRNIGKKATAPNEASSCLPLCVENIAANVLTSISFAFSSCILVIIFAHATKIQTILLFDNPYVIFFFSCILCHLHDTTDTTDS